MSRRVGLWQLCAACVLLGFALAASARAAQPAPQPQPLTVVFVRIDPAMPDAASVDGLEAQLGELSAQVVTAPAIKNLTLASQAFRAAELARAAHALGTIWFSSGDDQRLRVYVYDAKHRQLASRTLSGADAAEREELAVVLRSAISALIAGEQTALEPVAIPPPKPAAPPRALPHRPAPDRGWQFLLGAGYAGTTYASGTFQHGFQLRLGAELGSRFLFGVVGTWFQQARLVGGGAEAILDRYPIELSAGYAFAHVRRFRCFANAGLLLERVTRSTRVTDARLHALPDENRYRFAVAPSLDAVFEPTPGLLGFAGFGAEIATDRYDYVVQSTSGPARLAPRIVRPRLQVGAVVRFR